MALEITLYAERWTNVYSSNITRKLGAMAKEAGIYDYLWDPDSVDIECAESLIEPLTKGLELLKSDPERFRKFNPSNGWGKYEDLCIFVENYIKACIENLDAEIKTGGR